MSETVKLYGINRLRETLVVAESTRRSMQGNRSKDTKPELALRRALWGSGLRGYRKNVRKLPGTPDIVYGPKRVAIFVHGCFWHVHEGCRLAATPSTRPEFWRAKLGRNVERDSDAIAMLAMLGWRVLVVWECSTRRGGVDDLHGALLAWIESGSEYGEIGAPPRLLE